LLTRELLDQIEPEFSVGGSHFGPELMLLVIASDARFVEVPVNYLPRVGKSSVTGDFGKAVRLGLQMILFIVRFRFRTAKTVRARRFLGSMDGRSSGAFVSGTADLPVSGAASRQTDFDAVAAAYDDSLPSHVSDHYLRKRVAFIRQHVPTGASILDVGSGTGVLAERLLLHGYNVTGADPYAAMLKRMTARNPKLNAVQAQGRRLPFEDATFDFTYCIAVMHHIANPNDVCETLAEMCRVTKPGGLVLVWDHNPRNPYWPILMRRVPQDTGAERLIPHDELVGGLVAAGATPIDCQTLGLMPDFVPEPLVPGFAALERVLEITPGLNRYCAHNVILARRNANSDAASS
jgi:SAM-dependent methyltransferase